MSDREYSTHEILLENRHLAFIGAGVAVLCLGSFLLGRWSERSRWENPDTSLPRVAGATAELPIVGGPPPGAPAERDEDGLQGEDILPGEAAAGAEGFAPTASPSEAAGAERAGAPVPTEPAAPRAEKARQAAAGDDLYIQVLATRQADTARELRDRLAQRRYPAAVVSSPDSQGRPLYRVRVGGYETRREAEQVAARLQKEERLKTWIP